MTYFLFLAIFLVIPLAVVLYLNWRDGRQGKPLPVVLDTWPAWGAVVLHVFIALIYTTPWDNYLVASGVWYYDPQRVTGLTLGWVPIEEYTFFVLQSLLTGFWLIYLSRRIRLDDKPVPPRVGLRVGAITVLLAIVIIGAGILASGFPQGRYAALILVWSLVPIMIQIGWGGHILWQYRKLVLIAIGSVTLYLSAADLLAIGSGVWTIDPGQSSQILIFGILPLEEFIFFLVTNTLLVFGILLALAKPSLDQFKHLLKTRPSSENRRVSRST